jgi:predicted DsbA family dithiol-disulfide isomerase
MADPITIDLYADLVCPWCYIGSERLDQAIAGTADVVVRHKPFMLQPGAPAEGVDIPEMLRKKYRADPQQMFARVEAAARDSGQTLDLSKQPRSYPTVRAHTLLRHAEARGTQRALARALYRANFDEGRNIADVGVLAELASAHGFDAAEVEALLTSEPELAATSAAVLEAAGLGIRGVPFFVFDGKLAVSGAQPVDVLRAALSEATAAMTAGSSTRSDPP